MKPITSENRDGQGAPSGSGLSETARLWGIFGSPRATLADVARRPSFLLPLLVALAASLSVGYVSARWIFTDSAIERLALESIQSDERPIDESALLDRVRQRADMMSKVRRLWPIGTAVELGLIVVVVTALYRLAFRVQRVRLPFRTMLSVTCWSWMVWTLVFAASAWLTVALADSAALDPTDAYVLSMANLARALPAESAGTFLFTLAANLSLQNVWFLALLAIGYSELAGGISRARVSAVVFGVGIAVFIARGLLGF